MTRWTRNIDLGIAAVLAVLVVGGLYRTELQATLTAAGERAGDIVSSLADAGRTAFSGAAEEPFAERSQPRRLPPGRCLPPSWEFADAAYEPCPAGDYVVVWQGRGGGRCGGCGW